jgi:hypothetical protein
MFYSVSLHFQVKDTRLMDPLVHVLQGGGIAADMQCDAARKMRLLAQDVSLADHMVDAGAISALMTAKNAGNRVLTTIVKEAFQHLIVGAYNNQNDPFLCRLAVECDMSVDNLVADMFALSADEESGGEVEDEPSGELDVEYDANDGP